MQCLRNANAIYHNLAAKKEEFFWARFSQEIFSHIKLFLRILTKNKAEKRNFSFDEMLLKSWMLLFTQLLVFVM
jgi:hypothetical protein